MEATSYINNKWPENYKGPFILLKYRLANRQRIKRLTEEYINQRDEVQENDLGLATRLKKQLLIDDKELNKDDIYVVIDELCNEPEYDWLKPTLELVLLNYESSNKKFIHFTKDLMKDLKNTVSGRYRTSRFPTMQIQAGLKGISLKSTLVHELTHQAARLIHQSHFKYVYQFQCAPYHTEELETQFKEAYNHDRLAYPDYTRHAFEEEERQLDQQEEAPQYDEDWVTHMINIINSDWDILEEEQQEKAQKTIFYNIFHYHPDLVDNELIARVAEVRSALGEQKAHDIAPELNNYYEQQFTNSIKEAIDRYKARARPSTNVFGGLATQQYSLQIGK